MKIFGKIRRKETTSERFMIFQNSPKSWEILEWSEIDQRYLPWPDGKRRFWLSHENAEEVVKFQLNNTGYGLTGEILRGEGYK